MSRFAGTTLWTPILMVAQDLGPGVAHFSGPTGYRLLDRPLKVGHEGVEVV